MFVLDNPNARGFTPAIQIIIDGKEVSGPFYSRLIKATIHDEAGQSSDMATFELDDARNELEIPREKARVEINHGYKETGLRPGGIYELQSIKIKGGKKGEMLVLQAKAADLRRALKGTVRQAYENTTYGDIARQLAKRSGLTAVVDPQLDKIPIPYELQHDQSDIDFLTRLSDEHDAILKPAGGKLVAVQRGSGKSATGQELSPLVIRKSECEEWEIEPNGRVEYGKVQGSYIDQKTGDRIDVDHDTGLSGPVLTLPDTYADKDRAKIAARAEGRRLNRNTGDGFFKFFGRPEAMAEQTVMAEGFRPEINGKWRIQSVDHEFDESGYYTTVNIKAPESGRKSKSANDSPAQPSSKTEQPDNDGWTHTTTPWGQEGKQ